MKVTQKTPKTLQKKSKDTKILNTRFSNSSKILVTSAILGAIAVLVFYLFFSKHINEKCLASIETTIKNVSVTIACSADYKNEIEKYPGCTPQTCGRYISDQIATDYEVQKLLQLATAAISLGGSTGGASIVDLHSGALSKDEGFVDIYKLKSAVITEEILDVYSGVRQKIQQTIAAHFGLDPLSLYLTHPTFFSRITARPARTIHDEYWHPHVDKETYGSFHYTSLLYLTDYKTDFRGGRFVFIDKDQNVTVEPRAGRLSAFTSGSENLHFVEKVEEGTRYAITVSFTCDPNQAINDPKLR